MTIYIGAAKLPRRRLPLAKLFWSAFIIAAALLLAILVRWGYCVNAEATGQPFTRWVGTLFTVIIAALGATGAADVWADRAPGARTR